MACQFGLAVTYSGNKVSIQFMHFKAMPTATSLLHYLNVYISLQVSVGTLHGGI